MKIIRIGDFISEITDKATSNNQHMVLTSSQDGIVSQDEYFNKKVASKDTTGYKIIKKGQFTYRAMSDTGRFYINQLTQYDVGIVSPAYPVFEVNKNNILHPAFLQLFFRSEYFQAIISNQSSGSTRVSLRLDKIKKIEIAVPEYDEQMVIVERIAKLDTIISDRKQQINYFDELIKSRFIELFGTETEFDKWCCCTIGDVADVCVGVVIKPTQYYTDKGIPAFRSLNIGEMRVKDSDWVYFTEEGHQKNQKSVIRKNDILVVRSGAPGTACVVTEKYDGYNAVDIIIAHPDNSKVNSVFLAAFTNMPHGMNQIRAKTGGAAQQHFNVGGYKAMRLILPPIELQEQFAAFVEQTDKSKLAVQQGLQELEILKKSLMQQYFG